MEFTVGIDEEDKLSVDEELSGNDFGKITEFSIIPREGVYLGLDISENSSGVCMYRNSEKLLANIALDTKESEEFYEIKLRRELKGYLLEFIGGEALDLVIIEDAYQGINPNTTRKLYALNTAIDELILDGQVVCKKFVRVNNATWKSWLYSLDTENVYKGLKDKPRIEKCLELIGVVESGKGYQDRLDATGMLIGYFLEGYKSGSRGVKSGFGIGDICFSHKADVDFILEEVRIERGIDEVELKYIEIGQRKLSKDLIMENIKVEPGLVFVFSTEVALGAFGTRYNIESCEGKGYLGFWLRKGKYKKLGG